MKTIKEIGAQGDVLFIKVAKLPEGLEQTKDMIVAHSETGHHHVATGAVERFMAPGGDGMLSYMIAKGPVQIEHKRPWDTHETLELLYDGTEAEVIWEIRRQREHTPDGWRRVED